MKRLSINLAILILMTMFVISCMSVSTISTTSGVQQDFLSTIPKGAKIIYVDKENVTADSLYNELYSILLIKGHRIITDDKERHYIVTEGKDVGESTGQRMSIVVTEKDNISQLKITTEWKPGIVTMAFAIAASGIPIQSEWMTASWQINRMGFAFAESAAIANGIKDGKISYE